MAKLKCLLVLGAATLIIASVSSVAFAQQFVPIGKIDSIENGWFGEGLALTITGPGLAGCPRGPQEFAIAVNHPSYKELTAMALSAYVASSDVQLVATPGDCVMARTRIIALRLQK